MHLPNFLLAFFLFTNLLFAQKDCNQIPINDSLVVEPGTFFFNNTPINEFVKIYFNENNPPTIETIPNPCSHIHSGYKHAFQIKFTENSQIISANEIIESIQNENPGFAEFQLILNQELIKYYDAVYFALDEHSEITVLKNEMRENKLTISISIPNSTSIYKRVKMEEPKDEISIFNH